MCSVGQNGEERLKGHPTNPGSPARWLLN